MCNQTFLEVEFDKMLDIAFGVEGSKNQEILKYKIFLEILENLKARLNNIDHNLSFTYLNILNSNEKNQCEKLEKIRKHIDLNEKIRQQLCLRISKIKNKIEFLNKN